jgi:2OG-Fe(II) oxygenase superfamily
MESALVPAALFQSVDVQDKPYRFFTCDACLRADLGESLLVWLENGIKWSLAESEFYRQWECYLLSLVPPDNVAILFAPETLQYLRERVGELLAVQLSERLTIVAHKLVQGQFIDVHNDDPAPGLETHRLVIQLNRGRDQHSGGELRIHNSSKPADVFRVLPPMHNSAFGFEMTPKSFHSVMPRRQGTRYTIIFSFWSKAAEAATQKWQVKQNLLSTHDLALKTASEIASGLDPAELARLEQLTELLQSLGTGVKDHSGKTLLAHLVIHTSLSEVGTALWTWRRRGCFTVSTERAGLLTAHSPWWIAKRWHRSSAPRRKGLPIFSARARGSLCSRMSLMQDHTTSMIGSGRRTHQLIGKHCASS